MNYEQKYKEALERASHIKDNNTVGTPQEIAEHIFPELRESEDERIRKELIEFIHDTKGDEFEGYDISKNDALAWLEKQKEQKPVEWSEDDEEMRSYILNGLKIWPYDLRDRCISWLKSLRPQPHWKPSEEQMVSLVRASNRCVSVADSKELLSLYEDLKKL